MPEDGSGMQFEQFSGSNASTLAFQLLKIDKATEVVKGLVVKI
jgi:hypothetical protein